MKRLPRRKLGKTGKYYRDNPDAAEKKNKYNREYNKSSAAKKKRAEAGKGRADAKKNGVDVRGKDYDHATGKMVSIKKNRGRKEKSRLKGSKRK